MSDEKINSETCTAKNDLLWKSILLSLNQISIMGSYNYFIIGSIFGVIISVLTNLLITSIFPLIPKSMYGLVAVISFSSICFFLAAIFYWTLKSMKKDYKLWKELQFFIEEQIKIQEQNS